LTRPDRTLPDTEPPQLEAGAIEATRASAHMQGKDYVMAEIGDLDERTRTDLEAAAFRTLVEHLRAHPEVQNIDLMNLAGFCRNCLSKWYRAAAQQRGLDLSYEQARAIVYGMPYAEWKARYQTEATPEQQVKLAKRHPEHG
jgi:hypothetical protein